MVDYEKAILEFLKTQGGIASLSDIGEKFNLDTIKGVIPICRNLERAGKLSMEARTVKLILDESKPIRPSAGEDLEFP